MRAPVIRLASTSAFAAVLLFVPACSKKAPAGIDRLAILPVQNLSGDAALDALANAAQTVLVNQIAGSPDVYAFAADALGTAYGGRARRVVHAYLTEQAGIVKVAGSVEDLATHKMVGQVAVTGPVGQPLHIVDGVARQLAGQVRSFDTRNDKALEAYAAGIRTGDPALLEAAIHADGSFGSAYLALARVLLSRNDRDGAGAVLRRGMDRRNDFAAAERAQLELMDAVLRGDLRTRADAAAALARAVPADASAAVGAAESATLARQFPSAVEWYGRALKLDPDNAELWNQLGYAESYTGNLEGARSALLEYGKRTPNNPNGFDSLGEVHYAAGDFANAEKYFLEASRMNPGFLQGAPLWKAAHARLLTGDVAGADELAKRYFDLLRRAKDPLAEYRQACWDYVAGRRSQALANSGGAASGLMHAQRAVWMLDQGDRAKARDEAKQALADSRVPALRPLAVLAAYLSEPPATTEEWKARAARAFPGQAEQQSQPVATGYALVLAKQFREAVPFLKAAVASTPVQADAPLRFALGWAMVESGNYQEAEAHIMPFPVPAGGVEVFGSLTIPRILRLQATVLERQGKAAEAAKKLEIYRKLGGG